MRAVAVALGVGVVLAGSIAPPASAETAVIPELPGKPWVAFIDNPAIVDPHPMLAESWSRVADQQAVALHFTTGTPECYGVHATVAETAETVTVELRGGTLPGAVERACIMIAVSGSLEVPLQGPVGDRHVISVY
jgi:hypothetical protein